MTENEYPHVIEFLLHWTAEIFFLLIGAIVFLVFIGIVEMVLMGIDSAIPPEHGIMMLRKPKYSKFVANRYLRW